MNPSRLLLLTLVVIVSGSCAGSSSHDRSAHHVGYSTARKGGAVTTRKNTITVGNRTRTWAQVLADSRTAKALYGSEHVPAAAEEIARGKPMRHYGPFRLDSPNVRINGGSIAWFFNDFFNTNPDAAIYTRYFPGGVLPTDDPPPFPAGQFVPGEIPDPNSLHDSLFDLGEIRYSADFGGTIVLAFRTLEDVEYDVRGEERQTAGANTVGLTDDVYESLAWDLRGLEMRVQVTPKREAFNAAQNNQFVASATYCADSVGVVFVPQSSTAYSVRRAHPRTSWTTSLERSTDPTEHREELATTLQSVAGGIGGAINMWQMACRFAHAFVHSQFQNELGGTNLVTNIEVSDGLFVPSTTPGTLQVLVSMRVDHYDLNTESGGEEIESTLSLEQTLANSTALGPVVSRTYSNLDDGDGTPWFTYGMFLATDAGLPDGLLAVVNTKESDPDVPIVGTEQDQIFCPTPLDVGYDRVDILARANANPPQTGVLARTEQSFGLLDLHLNDLFPSDMPDFAVCADGTDGSVTVDTMVRLVLQ